MWQPCWQAWDTQEGGGVMKSTVCSQQAGTQREAAGVRRLREETAHQAMGWSIRETGEENGIGPSYRSELQTSTQTLRSSANVGSSTLSY